MLLKIAPKSPDSAEWNWTHGGMHCLHAQWGGAALNKPITAQGLSFPQTEEGNKVPHSHPRRQEVSMLLNVPYQGP